MNTRKMGNADRLSKDLAESDISKEELHSENVGGAIGGTIGGAIGGPIELTERQQEIIDLIEKDSKISLRKIAKKLNINSSAVQEHLNALKKKGVLERVGGTRGYWKVLRNESK